MSDGDRIQVTDLPAELRDNQNPLPKGPGGSANFQEAVADFKLRLIRSALNESQGNVTAQSLGLNSNYLHRLMNDLGLR